MGGLGKPGEQFEGLLGGAMLLGDKDALGLLDNGAGFHRPPHVLSQRGRALVEAGTGAVPFTGAGSLPPGGGSHRTRAYLPPSRNGYILAMGRQRAQVAEHDCWRAS